MSTRQRGSAKESNGNLPPKREGKAVRHDVSKPLQHVSLPRVVNLLAIFALLFTAFYAYRFYQYKAQVGGWWNLATGKRPPPEIHFHPAPPGHWENVKNSGGGNRADKDVELEAHIEAIADILGMVPTDLASALSSAVHQHVAPKTISSISASIASSASKAGASAPAASVLFSENENSNNDPNSNENPGFKSGEGVVDKAGTIAKAVDAFVGLDEPIVAD